MSSALGWSAHSGWAVAVAIDSAGGDPVMVARERVVLLPPELPRQPYHAAEGRPLAEAEAVIERVIAAARGKATEAMAAMVASVGAEVDACAVLGEPRELPALERILASHALLHAAEGVLYREVLLDAAAELELPATLVSPAGLGTSVQAAMGWDGDRQVAWLTALGRAAGPPWQQDHKRAALAALVVLSS